MTAPVHHIPEELLADHAAGSAGAAADLAVTCHLTLCPHCRQRLREQEAIAGALFAGSPEVAPSQDAWTRVLQQIETPSRSPVVPPPPPLPAAFAELGLPSALARRVAARPHPAWRFLAPGVKSVGLTGAGTRAQSVRLVRFKPGFVVPRHDHRGTEYTVVIRGAYDKAGDRYSRGDIEVRHPGEAHEQQILPDEACVALVINEGPLVPLTWKGKLFQAVMRVVAR